MRICSNYVTCVFLQFLQDNQDVQTFTLPQDFSHNMQLSQNVATTASEAAPAADAMTLNQQLATSTQQLLDPAIVTDVQLQSALQQQGQVVITHEQLQQLTQQQPFAQTPQITQLSDGSFFVDNVGALQTNQMQVRTTLLLELKHFYVPVPYKHFQMAVNH